MGPTHVTTLRLDDGRRLSYQEHGDPSGRVVFLFHGTPGSRVSRHPDASIARRLGARVITVDRPGYGGSDFKPRRRLIEWPDDVEQLADAVGAPHFAVVGVSGGGAHAAACAYKLPDRVTHAALVNCPAPLSVPGLNDGFDREHRMQFSLARKAPWLLRLLLKMSVLVGPHEPGRALRRLELELPLPDVDIVKQPGVLEMFLSDSNEAFKQGARACTQEFGLLADAWGFPLDEIRVPVHLWHGGLDETITRRMTHYLAENLPNSHTRYCPADGHLLFINRWEEILRTVLAEQIELEIPFGVLAYQG